MLTNTFQKLVNKKNKCNIIIVKIIEKNKA